MTIQPNELTKKYAPWSISKANTAKQCPYRFRRQYIMKEKVPEYTNVESTIGNVVHKALEYALSGRPMRMCLSVAADEYNMTTNEKDTIMAYLPACENFLEKFETYKKKHNGHDVSTETRLAVTYDGTPTRFFNNNYPAFFRGVIDVHMFLGDRHAVIIDHKTGRQHDMSYYEPQFQAYVLLLKATFPNLTGMTMGINFLKEDTIAMREGGKLLQAADIMPAMNYITDYVNGCADWLVDLDRRVKGPLCGWCEYQSTCPSFSNVDGINGSKKTE